MGGIVDIQLGSLRKLLADRRIALELDDKARRWLADKGYDPAFGARPLKRVIQTYLQNELAGMILRGDITDGSLVRVSEKDGSLDFKIGKATAGKEAA
jgi:ATP-dependent Clp protease ATP-binding subunit ClpB